MIKIYPAVIHKEDQQYWAEFPDLPGCQSMGDSMEEIIENATEALGLYLCELKEVGKELPPASDIEKMKAPEDGFLTLVSVERSKYERKTKAVRKNVTIPEWLSQEAERKKINFSVTLTEALEQKLQNMRAK